MYHDVPSLATYQTLSNTFANERLWRHRDSRLPPGIAGSASLRE